MTPTLEREPKISVGKKPAKGWKNKYWSPVPTVDCKIGPVAAGEFWGNTLHPTKDIAESYAMARWPVNSALCPGAKYLGAFPFPLDNTQ